MDPTAPLLVSADPLLVADVQRLAAAAGVVARRRRAIRRRAARWAGAPVVLVGADAAPALAGVRPPRRRACTSLGRRPAGRRPLPRRARRGRRDRRRAAGLGGLAGRAAHRRRRRRRRARGHDRGDRRLRGSRRDGVRRRARRRLAAARRPDAAARRRPAGRGHRPRARAGVGRGHPLGRAGADHRAGSSSRSLREALPRAGRLSVLTWPADRSAAAAAVRGARGALGRRVAASTSSWSTCRATSTPSSRRRSRAATTWCCVSAADRARGRPRPPGWRRRLPECGPGVTSSPGVARPACGRSR